MFSTFLSLGLALLPVVSAEVHDIQVGNAGQLVFQPEAIFAQPGDQVVFHFQPKNHSVTQSTFDGPCTPKPGGVNSGFMPVADASTSPTFSVTINDTNPFWVHCEQAANTANSHCGAGMVFAVNCGQDGAPNSFANFKKAAQAIGASLKAGGSGSSAAASSTWTAAYGGFTVPPPPTPQDVTQTITLESSTWVTSYSSYPNSPAPTPAALAGTVHKVIVGGPGKLAYDPPHIAAQPRDIVTFEFHQKNHTVTQSSFNDPCRPLSGGTGFDSQFQPVQDSATTFPTWNITVNDTAPIWAYCRQQNHCGSGMVFAINSDESGPRNFSAFQALAKNLNGSSALSTPSPSPKNGAASLRVGGALALGLGAVIACLL
jgi:plastocyanin